ncbi:hypothetical protein D3Z36_03195 [Lachnospiraceae bacterium]|nr:hypothetical protein [Lachnospiraceae bacterium]
MELHRRYDYENSKRGRQTHWCQRARTMAKSGNTKAYQEYRQKDIARREGSYSKLANELMAIFSELGGLKHVTPDSDEVQKKISALQKFITDNYYVCTKEILSGLGEMYICDERIKKNIDRAGGESYC